MLKRAFDIFFSLLGLIIISPLLLLLSVFVVLESKGGAFYLQKRVGRNNRDFSLVKFRTMHTGSDLKGLLTVGQRDPRITRTGYYLRKYKLDELPQLINVLLGDMSFVGPRPEVRKYVDMYSPEQLLVLSVRPGITDLASLEYFEENKLLAQSANPEKIYIEEVMPHKLELNLHYIRESSLLLDIRLILRTIFRIFA